MIDKLPHRYYVYMHKFLVYLENTQNYKYPITTTSIKRTIARKINNSDLIFLCTDCSIGGIANINSDILVYCCKQCTINQVYSKSTYGHVDIYIPMRGY